MFHTASLLGNFSFHRHEGLGSLWHGVSFEAKLLNDQICYEVDLDKYSNKNNIKSELEIGFNFIMDYNEDRQVTFQRNYSKKIDGVNWADSIVESDQLQHAVIYVETIGRL